MSGDDATREPTKTAFDRLRRARAEYAMILALTTLVGFGAARALAELGIDHRSIRWSVAVLVAYAAMLGMLGAWAWGSRHLQDAAEAEEARARSPRGQGIDPLFADDIAAGVVTEFGCLGGVAAVVIAVVAGLFLMNASAIFADLLVELAAAGVLVGRARQLRAEQVFSVLVRRTWWLPVLAAWICVVVGMVMDMSQGR